MSYSFHPEKLDENQKSVAANCQKHVDQYAKEGLRTLCFAKKVCKCETHTAAFLLDPSASSDAISLLWFHCRW